MKKYVINITFILLGLFTFIGLTKPTEAAEVPSIQITLHKLLFEAGQVPEALQNDGQVNPFAEQKLLQEYEGINGATFSVYDVTNEFYQLRAAGKSISAAQEQLSKQQPTKLVSQATTATINGVDGIAGYQLPIYETNGQQRPKAYLFVETQLPDNVQIASDPLVVILPTFDSGGKMQQQLQLYPKNEEVAYHTPPLEKVVKGKKDIEYGEQLPFEIKTKIPVDVWNYENYELVDQADTNLLLDPNSLKVMIDGKSATDLYQVSQIDKHGFKLKFDSKALRYDAGKTLKVTYQMKVNDVTQQATDFRNRVMITPGDHPKLEKTVVEKTGGKRFVKVDYENQNKTLANAKFVVRDQYGHYLSRKNNQNTWVDSSSLDEQTIKAKDLLVLTSDINGSFAINGLHYGKYQLLEIKAPKGYQSSSQAFDFTVNATSYLSKPQLALKIVNKTQSKSSIIGGRIFDRFLQYPKTNDTFNWKGCLTGIIIVMLIVMVFIRRRSMEKENRE
ncbi:SpaH/EbpB family LPXTG-anchored major pilin [Enterococcus devriesei]|uniref:SpaH/EbpB family LPXTG-anchored major pilin n=1 Tax=Enterococcus devriesei TaxID=319970 RepID=UPI0036D2847B